MKEKGFTLIELLAVIVILAIIALIAVPIILNIIDSTKDSANQRSVELYGKSIENYIAKAQLNDTNIEPGDLNDDFISKVEYKGSRVECTTNKLNPNGTIYLAGCKVDGKDVEYTYGKEQLAESTQVVYRWSFDTISIGDTIDPSDTTKFTVDPTALTPQGENYYLKHVIDGDNKVIESYLCTVFNDKETCLRGGSSDYYGYAENESEYTGNAKILKGLQDEGCSCNFSNSVSYCDLGSFWLEASSDSGVSTNNDAYFCFINGNGISNCGA